MSWNIFCAVLVASTTLIAAVYLVAISGLLAIVPVACGIVFSNGMQRGVDHAKPSAWKRTPSLLMVVIVYMVLTLFVLVPSVFIGLHSGVLAFAASAWATVVTMGATIHYRLRRM